jgi:hypothetical protein
MKSQQSAIKVKSFVVINTITEAWMSSPCFKSSSNDYVVTYPLLSVMSIEYKCNNFNSTYVNQRVVAVCRVRSRIHTLTAAYELYTTSQPLQCM